MSTTPAWKPAAPGVRLAERDGSATLTIVRTIRARARPWIPLVLSGLGTTLCYGALFRYETQIMAHFTRTDGLYPLLPVMAAFLFSLVHGAFTGYFWDVVGVSAHPATKEAAGKESEA